MISNGLRLNNCTALGAIFLLHFSLQSPGYGQVSDPTESLDKGLDQFEDHRYKNAENTLLELAGDSAFRRLDYSQRSLVYSHIAYSKINRGKELESIPYLDKALSVTRRESGERSMPYLDHMRSKSIALYWADKRRDAIRVGENMLGILERMGDDYRDEHAQVRRLITRMKKIDLEEGELPEDLSDFYTDCESIEKLDSLTRVNSIMNDYLLVGTDFTPGYKQASYFKNAYLKHARESSQDRRTRIIYVPDKQHLDFWCVIYPDGKRVGRTVTSTKNDQ